MISFNKCPRCDAPEFEQFAKYGTCHDCSYFEVRRNRAIADKKIKKRNEDAEAPHLFRASLGLAQERFTEEDHRIVRKALLSIPEKEKRIVILHFWRRKRKFEIAEKFGIDLEQVELILESAFDRLRTLCLHHPRFSRALDVYEEAA